MVQAPAKKRPSAPATKRPAPPAKRPPGPPAKRPPGPPAKRAPGAQPTKRSPPPGKRPPTAPGKRPPAAPTKRVPPAPAPKPEPDPSPAWTPPASGRISAPTIVFAVAFLLSLLLSLRVVFVGAVPLSQTFTDVDWFPLGVFDIVVAMSFIVWPFLATWGAKHRKQAAVWTGTLAYLGVSILFLFSFGAEHLLLNGPVMIVGTVWFSVRR